VTDSVNYKWFRSSKINSKKEKTNKMKTKAVFYHAGCPVCVDAESSLADGIDLERFDVEIVHLGDSMDRISEAESVGVKSVPALVIGDRPYHINFGAAVSDLK
jgi:glutaredoxin